MGDHLTTSYKHVYFPVQEPSPGAGVAAGSKLPPGARVDTNEDEGGAGGFSGFVGSAFFTIPEGPSALAVGIQIDTGGDDFTAIGGAEAEEDPVADLKFTCYRIYPNQQEEQSKFSASPEVDISGGTWGGVAAARFETPVLLTPGNYRVDFAATLSEDYEFDFDGFPEVAIEIVNLLFEKVTESGPDGTPLICDRAHTAWNLTTGAEEDTDYAFDEDFEPPLAVDVTTYPKMAGDWISALIARTITGVPLGVDRRQWLIANGWIDGSNWGQVTNLVAAAQGNIGGAITTQQTYKEAIGRICEECRIAFDWTGPLARLLYIPDSSVSADRALGLDDIIRVSATDPTPLLDVEWTGENAVVNLIDGRWGRDYSLSGKEAYVNALARRQNADSIAYIGRQANPPAYWLDWAISEAHASDTVDCWIAHLGRPRRRVSATLLLKHMDLIRGDIVTFNLQPVITIGDDPGIPDENQGWDEGGWSSGGWSGTPVIPPGTIKGEVFAGLTSANKFMAEQVFVNWSTKRVEALFLEVP